MFRVVVLDRRYTIDLTISYSCKLSTNTWSGVNHEKVHSSINGIMPASNDQVG